MRIERLAAVTGAERVHWLEFWIAAWTLEAPGRDLSADRRRLSDHSDGLPGEDAGLGLAREGTGHPGGLLTRERDTINQLAVDPASGRQAWRRLARRDGVNSPTGHERPWPAVAGS